MRLLLVENDAWDAGLVQEALDELEERPQEKLLPRPLDLFHAESVEEALQSLDTESYDLVLLSGARGLQPMLRMREAAPKTPIVLLTPREEEGLALAAMREGAAGYMLKEDIDCLPLARTLRSALERHQALLAREEMPGADELTGLTTRTGFLFLGEMALKLAGRWSKPARLSVVRLSGYKLLQDVYGAQARDLALIETAEMMRELLCDADLLARTGVTEFAALSIGPAESQRPLEVRVEAWDGTLEEKLTGARSLAASMRQ
jgi:PleD family two-component response regulator